ncbi:hypothetical protein Tco_1058050 [Tanacetum coccineum]|uniref:Uncharacterized protein n=1 Tax=Tanacetum coccineum TaxID=301880 RepID=A0ABQ5H995_9ASTR
MVAYLKKPTGSEGFQEITATDKTLIMETRDNLPHLWQKHITITDASVRRHLQLADADGLKEGEGSGNPSEPQPPPSTTQPTHEEQIPTSVHIPNVADEAVFKERNDRVVRATTTAAHLDAAHANGNILKTQSTTMPNVPLPQGIRGYTPGSDEGSMTLNELTVLYTRLSNKVKSLEAYLKQTKQEEAFPLPSDAAKKFNLTKRDESAAEDFHFVTPTKISASGEAHSSDISPEDQLGVLSTAKILADAGRSDTVPKTVSEVQTYTRRRRAVSTGSGGVSTASRIISTAEETVSTTGASMPVSTAGIVQESTSSPRASKDKGKAIMTESEPEQAITKLKERQERAGYEASIRLQEQLAEEENQRIARDAEGFIEDEWEDIRARVEADEELTQRLQAEERDKYSEVDQAKMLVDLINERKIYFAAQKAEAKRNKPMTQAQQRNYMINYIKHMGNKERASEVAAGSSKRPAETKLDYEIEEVYIEALQTFVEILKRFDRDDLEKIWDLVKKRFSSIEPTDDKEKELWVKLKRLFEPDNDDILWKLQRYMHDPLVWSIYDTCGVHHVSTGKGYDIFMLLEKDYLLSNGVLMLMLVNSC